MQKIVIRDHVERQAIGIVDESGFPKRGTKTACVHRDYCGAMGPSIRLNLGRVEFIIAGYTTARLRAPWIAVGFPHRLSS